MAEIPTNWRKLFKLGLTSRVAQERCNWRKLFKLGLTSRVARGRCSRAEGLKCSSEGEGDVSVKVVDSTVNDNKDDGMQFEAEEDNVGIITVVIENTVSTGNRKKDLKVEQKVENPKGTLSIDEDSNIEDFKFENVVLV